MKSWLKICHMWGRRGQRDVHLEVVGNGPYREETESALGSNSKIRAVSVVVVPWAFALARYRTSRSRSSLISHWFTVDPEASE